ncbi:phage SPO1 DNA polymerase-related protein [Desulfosarcina variabilis str. Montpellier]|uniref:uracil-DNA glycosylase n=1 Tax=Desulfosarcina variabilis TaxID=2300 RepID=UPI003AFA30EF
MTSQAPLAQIFNDIRNTLHYLKESGCTGFDCSDAAFETLTRVGPPMAKHLADKRPIAERHAPDRSAIAPSVSEPRNADRQVVARPESDRPAAKHPAVEPPAAPETLDDIRAELGDCTRCPLCKTRTHIVFGEGAADARLVFVGEGPGFEEDQCGRPFVGAAGQLLTKIIAAMKLSRETVYIANIVKCRPPDNRNPEPGEIHQCLPFLKRQLAAINPTVICALGSVPARTLLDTQTSISRLRGRFHAFMDIPLMPTFHPAYLLRNPQRKRDVWNDVQQIMRRLA